MEVHPRLDDLTGRYDPRLDDLTGRYDPWNPRPHMSFKASPPPIAEQSSSNHKGLFRDKLDVPCAVCGDRATGVFYGVYACYGCKSFFSRIHLRKEQLVCLRDNRCVVSKETRTHCQACRYQRCLRAGMVIDESVTRQCTKTRKLDERESQPRNELINTLISAHHDTFLLVSNAHSQLKGSLPTAYKELGVEGSLQAQQFALKVPGISSLLPATQQVVLSHAVPELMILQLASRFVPEEKGFILHGYLLPLAVVVEILGRALASKLVRIATFLIYTSIDETELALLCGLTVTLPDCLSAISTDMDALEKQFRAHLCALLEYEMEKRCSKPLTVGKILLRLIDVWVTALHGCGQLIENYIKQTDCNGQFF